MDNLYIGVGEFGVNEFQGQPPHLEETETSFDTEDLCAIEQSAFPILDGVLFPIVVANAEVIAPCSWMGGAEVSLTIALNNYYQAMTEENASEIIADVRDFLLNRIEINEEDEVGDEIVLKVQTGWEEDMDIVDKERAEESSTSTPAIQRVVDTKIVANLKKDVQTQHVYIEEAVAPQTVDLESTIEETIQNESHAITTVESELFGNNSMRAVTATLEKKALPSEPESPKALLNDKVDIAVGTTITLQIEPDRNEAIPASSMILEVSHEPKIIYDVNEISAPSYEKTEPSVDLSDSMEEDNQQEVYEVATGARHFDQEYDWQASKDEYESMAAQAIFELVESSQDSEEDEEQMIAADYELPAHIDLAIDKIHGLLMDLSGDSEVEESEMLETVHELTDVITVVLEQLESVDDVSEIQEELQLLFAEFLDKSTYAHKSEFVALLTSLTLERQYDDEEVNIVDEAEEITAQALRDAIRQWIQDLAVMMHNANKALTRVLALGRSALRLGTARSQKQIMDLSFNMPRRQILTGGH